MTLQSWRYLYPGAKLLAYHMLRRKVGKKLLLRCLLALQSVNVWISGCWIVSDFGRTGHVLRHRGSYMVVKVTLQSSVLIGT